MQQKVNKFQQICLVWKVWKQKKDAIQPFFMLARKAIMVMWVRDEILDSHTAPFSMWKSQVSEMWIKEKLGHFIYGRTLLLQQEWERPLELVGVDSNLFKSRWHGQLPHFCNWNQMTWMTFVHILLIVVLHQTIVQAYCFGSLLLMSQLLFMYYCISIVFCLSLKKKRYN